MIEKEKTIHVQTSKVSGHDVNGEPIKEVLVTKLRANGANGPFEEFLKVIKNNKFTKLVVVGIYTPEFINDKKEKVSAKLETEKGFEKYQTLLDEVLNPTKEVVVDYKAKYEEQEARLAKLEAAIAGGNSDTTGEGGDGAGEDEYKKELQEEIKELGGKYQGLHTIEGLEKRLEELKAS